MALLSKNQWPCLQGFIWVFYYVPLVYMSVFMTVPYCFDYCHFVIDFKSRSVMPPSLFFLLKIALDNQDLFVVHFRIVLFLWKMHWDFDRDCKTVECDEYYGYFNNIKFSNPGTQNGFPFNYVFLISYINVLQFTVQAFCPLCEVYS